MVLKLVIFDLDGTLVTAEINFLAMRSAIRDLLKDHGFPSEVLPMHSTQELLRQAFAYAGEKGMTPIEISQLRDRAYEIAVEIEWIGARRAQLVEGSYETLRELQRRQVNVGVLTNDNRDTTDYLLTKYALTDYVNKVVSRDDVPHMKPATDGLKILLKHFQVTPEETIFVGDSTIDMMTARKLNIRSIGRLSNVRPAEALKAEGATKVISTLGELIPYLDSQGLLPPPQD